MAAVKDLITSAEAMPPPPTKPSRKRSSGEMQEDTKSVESLQTVTQEIAQLAQQGKVETQDVDSSAMLVPDSQTQGRSQVEQRTNEPKPSSVAHSQKVPPSAQGHRPNSKAPKASKAGIKKGKKAAEDQAQDDVADDENGDSNSVATDASDDVGEPCEAIRDFDWHDLNQRYHAKMEECNRNEQRILAEFGQLIDSFRVWAQSGNAKESDRSFKRFKTQELYVHHEEDGLERKRQHYIRVVGAFQSALQLLNA